MATRYYYKIVILILTINFIYISLQNYPSCPPSVSSKSVLNIIEDTTWVQSSNPWNQPTEAYGAVYSSVSESMYYLFYV